MIGASVIVKGTTIGVSTDQQGFFVMNNVPAKSEELQISYLGYVTQDVKIRPNMQITLVPDEQTIESVVVTGMTKTDKRLFTGAADRLSADDVKLSGMADISRGLEGRSAGVSVQNVSGTFGTAPRSASAVRRRFTAARSRFGSWTASLWRMSPIFRPRTSLRVTPRR